MIRHFQMHRKSSKYRGRVGTSLISLNYKNIQGIHSWFIPWTYYMAQLTMTLSTRSTSGRLSLWTHVRTQILPLFYAPDVLKIYIFPSKYHLLFVTTPMSPMTFGWLNWHMMDASDKKSFWFFSLEPGWNEREGQRCNIRFFITYILTGLVLSTGINFLHFSCLRV